MNTHVLLLREASDSEDKYEAAFRSKLYVPVSIPVLEPVTTNQDELRRLVNAGPSSSLPFAGVIVTSSRASHAWEHAIASLSHDSSPGRQSSFLPSIPSQVFIRMELGPVLCRRYCDRTFSQGNTKQVSLLESFSSRYTRCRLWKCQGTRTIYPRRPGRVQGQAALPHRRQE